MTTNTLIQEAIALHKLNKMSPERALAIIDLAVSRDYHLKDDWVGPVPEPDPVWIKGLWDRLGWKMPEFREVDETNRIPTLPELLAEKNRRKPKRKDRIQNISHGQRAYMLRDRGYKWSWIGTRMGIPQQHALMAAKNYAKKNNLAWPIAR